MRYILLFAVVIAGCADNFNPIQSNTDPLSAAEVCRDHGFVYFSPTGDGSYLCRNDNDNEDGIVNVERFIDEKSRGDKDD